MLDFYCAKARLAIEIDGASHDFGDRPQRDAQRDVWLKANGITVVHIPAAELQYELEQIRRLDCATCARGAVSVRPLHHPFVCELRMVRVPGRRFALRRGG